MSTPLFSILHTSARPEAWRAVYDDWMSKAVHPENVEYVLCVDERWGFNADTLGRGLEGEIAIGAPLPKEMAAANASGAAYWRHFPILRVQHQVAIASHPFFV